MTTARPRRLEYALSTRQALVDSAVELFGGQGYAGTSLDEVVKRLPERPRVEETEVVPREPGIAIIGRPNVGKSSLVNRILREERVLVSEVAGTTRDAVDATFLSTVFAVNVATGNAIDSYASKPGPSRTISKQVRLSPPRRTSRY